MYRPIIRSSQGRLLKSLRISRVSVAHSGGIFSRGPEFHEGHCFGDDVGSTRADHVDAQYLICLLVGEYFDHSFGISTGAGAAQCFEWKFS